MKPYPFSPLDNLPNLVLKRLVASFTAAYKRQLFNDMCDVWWVTINKSLNYNYFRSYAHMATTWQKKEFVRLELTKKDDTALQAYIERNDNDYIAEIQKLLGLGYKISLNFIEDKSAYTFTVTGTDKAKHNQNSVMTSWSDNISEGIFMMAFKVIEVAKRGDWKLHETSSNNWG